MRLNFQVRLYPNQTMKTVLDSLCDYRRYCWNQGLELWNTMYDARLIGLPVELQVKIKASLTDKTIEFSEEEQMLRALFPAPNERKVRDELVAQKTEWELALSPRVLQLAIKDLATAWNLFFDNQKTANKPGFKSRKKPKQGFIKFARTNGNSPANVMSVRIIEIQKVIKQREPSCKQPTNEFAMFKMTYSTSLPLTCITRMILL